VEILDGPFAGKKATAIDISMDFLHEDFIHKAHPNDIFRVYLDPAYLVPIEE